LRDKVLSTHNYKQRYCNYKPNANNTWINYRKVYSLTHLLTHLLTHSLIHIGSEYLQYKEQENAALIQQKDEEIASLRQQNSAASASGGGIHDVALKLRLNKLQEQNTNYVHQLQGTHSLTCSFTHLLTHFLCKNAKNLLKL
jgi:hypothetical protein